MKKMAEIREKFPDLEVVEVVGMFQAGVNFWGFKRGDSNWPSAHAQSMKGFRGYVHMFGDYFVSPHPILVPSAPSTHYCRAVAVLFRKEATI